MDNFIRSTRTQSCTDGISERRTMPVRKQLTPSVLAVIRRFVISTEFAQ